MNKPLTRRSAIDPAVADILAGAEKKQRIAGLPKAERAKARRDTSRHKVGLDLPPELHDLLRFIAAEEQVSVSSLVSFLAYHGVKEYQAGNIDLFPHKRISRSARFEYVLTFEPNDN